MSEQTMFKLEQNEIESIICKELIRHYVRQIIDSGDYPLSSIRKALLHEEIKPIWNRDRKVETDKIPDLIGSIREELMARLDQLEFSP